MNKEDETELYRLTDLLSQISKKTELTEAERDALRKSALALSVAFIQGYRKEVEEPKRLRNLEGAASFSSVPIKNI